MLDKASPIFLTQCAVAASLLVGTMSVPELFPWRRWIALGFVLLVPCMLGLAGSFWLEKRLETGLAAGKWPAEQIEVAHRWIKSTLVVRVQFLVFALWLIDAVMMFSRPHHHAVATMLVLPALLIPRLRAKLAPPTPVPTYTSWKLTLSPIHSDHWGE